MMKSDEVNELFFNGNVGDASLSAYFANMVDIAFYAMIAFDSTDRIIFWNPAAEKMFGWSVQEALGKTFGELCEPVYTSKGPEDQRQRLSSLESGATIKRECRLRCKDGSSVLVEYNARGIFDKDGKVSGYVSIHRDMTERNQRLEEISRLNAELQTQLDENNLLLEILPIGIWIGNHDCSVITGNSAAYRIMGLPPGINVSLSTTEIEMPLNLRIYVDGVEVAPEDAPMQTVARTGKPMYNFEHQFLFEGHTLKTFYASIVPVFDQKGKVRKVLAAYADFTERKQAEEQIRLAREYAERTADRLARLQKVTAALSESLTPTQVADVIVNQGAPALGAVSGTMMLLSEDGQWLEMIQSAAPEVITRSYQRFSIFTNVPASNAARSGKPIWIESRKEYVERYPQIAEQIEAWGNQTAIAIPLMVEERTLGVVTLSFKEILPQTPENLGFVLTIAQQGSQALERARLYRQTQQALSELQTTYDQSPIGMIQLDTDLRFIRVNETLAQMNGIPAADHIGKHIREIVPDLASKIEDGFRHVIKTGEPVFNIEVVGETEAEPGVPHTWFESWYPMLGKDGKVLGLNIVVQDITHRKRDEHALAEFARQQEALYKLADRLHRTVSLPATFDAALDAILNALQSDRASILLFDDSQTMRFVAWRGLSAGYRQATDRHSPWKHDEKDPQPICFNDIEAAELDDSLKTVIKTEGISSLAFIPLVFAGQLVGKFMVYFNSPHTFSTNEVDLGLTIAHQLAYSIQRIRAEDALRKSEAELAAELKDTRQLQRISSLLIREDNPELLYGEILNSAMAIMDSEMGSMQTLNEYGDELLLLASKGFAPASAAFWERVNFSSSSSCGVALRTGERVIVPDVEATDFMAETEDLRFSRLSGIRSVQSTPLVSRSGRIVGMISTHWRKPHQPPERQLHMLDVLARQAADLIERRRAEEALRKSEKQLQILNESLEQKVREQTAEVHQLASDLTKAEQRERQRIAHILHEDLQQRFHAIRMQVELLLEKLTLENPALQKDFKKINTQYDEILSIIRHLSIELSPPILRDEGLTQSVEWLASQMKKQYGLQVEVHVDKNFAVPDEDLQLLLFNCVRELVYNVVKHGGVKEAEVSLERLNGNVRIKVSDKGKGFDINEIEWHDKSGLEQVALENISFGLPTLRHRLSLFDGKMVINSEPGAGTQVEISIPIPQTTPSLQTSAHD